MKWWKMRQARKEAMEIPQWEEDYKLSALPDHHMFWEYLEVGKNLSIAQYRKLPKHGILEYLYSHSSLDEYLLSEGMR